MSDRIRFSYKGQLIEEARVQEVRDDVAAVLADLDILLQKPNDAERQADAATRRRVVEGLNRLIRDY